MEQDQLNRRGFLRRATLLGPGLLGAAVGCRRATVAEANRTEDADDRNERRRGGGRRPTLTFYGSTRQVSGSCHLLETEAGLFLVDCGLFFTDVPKYQSENERFPFDPRQVKAVFLTHAHIDHNGRLPLLYKQGFRGPVYCTDCTRDLTRVMLEMSLGVAEGSDEAPALYGKDDLNGLLALLEAVPYNARVERQGLAFRYTDAGHILGSAMVEVWSGGSKILFSGDMGNDAAPILCRPARHRGADAVLVESTYGPTPRDAVSFEDLGRRIMGVVSKGGSVLFPAFVLHKTQALVYVINRLKQERVIDPQIPVYSDSSTAQKITRIYRDYRDYYGPEARAFGELFGRQGFREARTKDSLAAHDKGPSIFVSSSGMLEHAAAPKHLWHLAGDPRNAVFIVGWQSPESLGRKLQNGERMVLVPWEEWEGGKVRREERPTEVKMQVLRQGGFSSHARGQQLLEWLAGFDEVGDVYVVHGDRDNALGLADKAREMGLNAAAPERGQTFAVGGARVKPGAVPALAAARPLDLAPVDK